MTELENRPNSTEPLRQPEEIDRLVAQLRNLPLADDEPISTEERRLFFELLGIGPPTDDPRIPSPTMEDVAQLQVWLEDRNALTADERGRLFFNFHHSAAWRSAVDQLRDDQSSGIVGGVQ